MSKLFNHIRFGTSKTLREHFLNPKGLTIKQIETLPKEKRNYDFQNWRQELYRIGTGKEVERNVATFKIDLRMTKPEIKQYLEKVYSLDVERINTTITHSPIKKNQTGKRYRKADKKKAYAFLKDIQVDDFFRKAKFMF